MTPRFKEAIEEINRVKWQLGDREKLLVNCFLDILLEICGDLQTIKQELVAKTRPDRNQKPDSKGSTSSE